MDLLLKYKETVKINYFNRNRNSTPLKYQSFKEHLVYIILKVSIIARIPDLRKQKITYEEATPWEVEMPASLYIGAPPFKLHLQPELQSY
jgi:hypothetical protein